jgi:CubicO group peptidase (beta-lactamase class C family)
MKITSQVKLIVLFTVLFLCSSAWAQQSTPFLLDSLYTSEAKTQQLMGNVFVADHGITVYKKSFGYQDIEKQVPNSDSSAFAMASVTKIFTATAIMQLKEKGSLQLNDAFAKYYPGFPYPGITIKQLLAHTSGLPAYELFDSLANALPDSIFGNKDVIPALKLWHKPLHEGAGEVMYYSSMNYCLLALLVEKLSGLSLQDYFSKYIFEPAGMQHSYLENIRTVRSNINRTINYETPASSSQLEDVYKIRGGRKVVYNYGGFIGQGGLITTTEDMTRFDKAYFSGKLISQASIEEATTPTKDDDGKPIVSSTLLGRGFAGYGLGWFVGVHPLLGKIVWHTGGRPGITTIYVHAINKKESIFIFENVRSKARLEPLALTTLEIINGLPIQNSGDQ